jgi:hypothetical protein
MAARTATEDAVVCAAYEQSTIAERPFRLFVARELCGLLGYRVSKSMPV